MIGQLSVQYPRMPILTISQDHQALLQSLQRGARYFLTHPVGLEDLLVALRRAVGDLGSMTEGSGTSPFPGRHEISSSIISILGTRGGVGSTSLAVNLAATLASDRDNSVALVDLDLALGDADITLEVSGSENFSIADLARNIDRLDMNFLRRSMARHEASNLSVLRHPLEIQEIAAIHEGHIERILNLLRVSYSHLVLDLSKAILATDLMALRMSDLVLLVVQLELSSLRNVVRMIHFFNQEESLSEKIRIVVNRVGAEAVEEGISLKKAEEVIGKPIFWQIPNDFRPMIAARVAGQPLITHSPRCRAQQAIAGLSQTICGKPVAADAEDSKRSSRASGWFFGRRS